MMATIHARQALLPHGWARNIRVTICGGRITSIERDADPTRGDELVTALLPGMPNLHSHAFQRGMAGLTERPGPSEDSFWTWRETMHRYALTMNPDQLEAVASWLYIEMLEAGFTRVGEFHYLHHTPTGTPYGNIAEMATRIAAATERTGIGLTLLPVFYAHGDFGGLGPEEGQRRFINDLASYERLMDACRDAVSSLDGAVVGVAPHSLRATTPEELGAVTAMVTEGPIHMHIAEQVREVEGCLAWSGQRPMTWLLDRVDVDERWCLIHATHMNDEETARFARTGAVAGLCPVTEANLGDGIFPGKRFLRHGGRFGIGTDANTRIGVTDELRQLEYSQRLVHNARNVLTAGEPTALALFGAACRGGQQALGVPLGGIEPRASADLVALSDALMLENTTGDRLLATWVFGQGVGVDRVWVNGRQVVWDGRHIARDEVAQRFRSTMRELPAGALP
jgi:formimidoylglutamate deiminase